MPNVAVASAARKAISRPLKVLVPLIKDELAAGDEAGLEHYRAAGQMLIEAKSQVADGSWGRWLNKHFEIFELNERTARRYMRLARFADKSDNVVRGTSYSKAIGEKPARSAWSSVHHAADRINVTRLVDERQARDDEIKLHRDLALQLIDLGYRALATRLHPDRGGSRDAMTRLNTVRDELKSIAATRRFV
jgi:hypothetical protein